MRSVLWLTLAPSLAFAAPVELQHQGRILGADGVALQGTAAIAFSVWDAANGGTSKWSDTFTNVSLSGGYYSVVLGSGTELDSSVFVGGERYLQVSVNNQVLGQRTLLAEVPYAAVAHSVQLGDSDVCDAEHAGVMRFQGGNFEGCDGVDWVALSSDFGSQQSPAITCAGIHTRRPGAPSGVYWVDPLPSDAYGATPVYCDMSEGWTLIAKASDGSAEGMGGAFVAGNSNVTNTAFLDRDQESATYVNPFAAAWWSAAGFTEARVELWRGGVLDRVIEFNAAGATNTSWFDMTRITSVTGWTDLPNATYNEFSLDTAIRDFYISYQHGGCPEDQGWLVIPETSSCADWHNPGLSHILYSGASTRIDWTTPSGTPSPDTRHADVMVVLAR